MNVFDGVDEVLHILAGEILELLQVELVSADAEYDRPRLGQFAQGLILGAEG